MLLSYVEIFVEMTKMFADIYPKASTSYELIHQISERIRFVHVFEMFCDTSDGNWKALSM